MKKNKNNEKNKKKESKFGVFNGNAIDNETLVRDQSFEIEEYSDDSFTILEVKSNDEKNIKIEVSNTIKPKKKINFFLYKLTAYIIILLLIVALIV